MTLPELYGCTFVAFGLPLALFVLTIATDAISIIIFIASAFFWLLALLASSLIWMILVPLREYFFFGVTISVVLQEASRYLIYRLLRGTEQGLEMVAHDSPVVKNKHKLAYVSGLGFGTIAGIFFMINLLADLSGPATVGLKGGSEIFTLTSAIQTLEMIMLHMFWSVILHSALDTANYPLVGYVLGSHLVVSLFTLLNHTQYFYIASIISLLFVFLSMVLAFKAAGGTLNSFKRFILCH